MAPRQQKGVGAFFVYRISPANDKFRGFFDEEPKFLVYYISVMLEAINQSIVFAIGIAIFPIPIITIILLLFSPKALNNSLAFMFSWIFGIATVGAITLILLHPYEPSFENQTANWTIWLRLILAIILIYWGIKKAVYQTKAKKNPKIPKWMSAIENFTTIKSAAAGFALSGLNPKNILIIIACATAILQTGINPFEQAITWAIFTFISTLGILIPIIINYLFPKQADKSLSKLKNWMQSNSSGILAFIFLLIGIKIIVGMV